VAEKKDTFCVIGSIGMPIRFSYLHVGEPKAINGSTDLKYSTAILIPKHYKVELKKIEAAIQAAIEAGTAKFGDKWKKSPKFKLPLNDGDIDKPDDAVYAGNFYLNATCANKPQVVDRKKNEILDKEEIYSGMHGLVSVNFFPFDNSGNKGVGVGLNNLMKTKEGDRLASQTSAADDFAEVDDDGSAAEEDNSFLD